MRILGVDYGTKRIGLALGDDSVGICSPLEVIAASVSMADNARSIAKAAESYTVDAIVIGLPLNMDGTAGPQAKLSHQLAELLKVQGDWSVHLHDERLTSHAADNRLLDRELTRNKKKNRQDAVAAQILLESYLSRDQSFDDDASSK